MDERHCGEDGFSSDASTGAGTESSRVSTGADADAVAVASSSRVAADTFAASAFAASASNLFTARSRFTRTLLTILYG